MTNKHFDAGDILTACCAVVLVGVVGSLALSAVAKYRGSMPCTVVGKIHYRWYTVSDSELVVHNQYKVFVRRDERQWAVTCDKETFGDVTVGMVVGKAEKIVVEAFGLDFNKEESPVAEAQPLVVD